MVEQGNEPQRSWWQTVPGILTGIAAIIAALTGLVAALYNGKTPKPPSPQPKVVHLAPSMPGPMGGGAYASDLAARINNNLPALLNEKGLTAYSHTSVHDACKAAADTAAWTFRTFDNSPNGVLMRAYFLDVRGPLCARGTDELSILESTYGDSFNADISQLARCLASHYNSVSGFESCIDTK